MLLPRRAFLATFAASAAPAASLAQAKGPWYQRTYRWGQTNITEKDPIRYDIAFWRGHWKRTRVQGIIVNAGGIVAYYPSKFPLQKRAEFLGDRDLFGDLVKAARADGIVVLARMDSSRASEDFYRAHPDWFALNSSGSPYRSADKYITCVNSAYYDEYLPSVLREIIDRFHPEGFTDNSWAGLSRGDICYCANCKRKFRDKTGGDLPARADWNDRAYRAWIEWSYDRRIEVWELNNRVTRAAGGPDCVWIGMTSGSVPGMCRSFRDYKRICERTPIIMLDHQSRPEGQGSEENSDAGKLIHGLLGWDKLIPESMPMYQMGRPNTFRLASKPPAEARMWMVSGFAGGIQPWWHHIGAFHEDRRMYRTAEPVLKWHEANQDLLVNRRPLASVGVVWTQRNFDFYGRETPDELVEAPYRGIVQALMRARIPYIPVHADHLEREAPNLSVLILPNLAAMTDAQCAAVRSFVERGGSLLATGVSSLYDQWGDSRADFGLAPILGVSAAGHAFTRPEHRRWASSTSHTYLRITQEQPSARHPALAGFDETNFLPFGGTLEQMKVAGDAAVLLTFIPSFPMFPPETSWMREERTTIPGLVVREQGKARVAYLAADIDRRYGRDHLPDHGDLLANLVRWVSNGRIPLRVEGAGLVDCSPYQQPGKVILHLVNQTQSSAWRGPLEYLVPVGPLKISLQPPADVRPRRARCLVSGETPALTSQNGWASFAVRSVVEHEVVVLE